MRKHRYINDTDMRNAVKERWVKQIFPEILKFQTCLEFFVGEKWRIFVLFTQR